MDSGGVGRGRVRVHGPLASFVDGVRRDLRGLGYAEDTICDHIVCWPT